ncbi:MAG: GGDEF domain-containing protein, partial [Coprobacillus sp.]
IPAIILIIFLILIRYNPLFNKKQSQVFTLATCTALFMMFVVSSDYIFTAFRHEPFVTLRTTTTFLNFAISPIIPILLDKISNTQKNSLAFYLPFIINVLLCIYSLFSGIVFSVSPNNGYDRGSLFFVPFLISIFYTFALLVRSNYRYLRSQKSERLYLLLVIGLLFFAMIAEIGFRFLFFVWSTASISLPLYYLLLNINQSILDPLTKAYNRAIYIKDIERLNNKKKCVIALLDINDFKLVNDTYGHDYGDKFLINFVSVISHCLPSTSSIYRIGGDEFVIISKTSDLKKISDSLVYAKQETLKENMDFSYGIDLYEPGLPLNDFIQLVDHQMYQNKKRDKAAKNS